MVCWAQSIIQELLFVVSSSLKPGVNTCNSALADAGGCLQGQVIKNRLTAVSTAYPGLLEPGYSLHGEE